MFESIEEQLGINTIKKQISNTEQQLSLLKQKLEEKKILIEKNSLFDLKEIIPILKLLVNDITNKKYRYEILKNRNANSINYMYILTCLNMKISNDSNRFYDELEKGNIIILAVGNYKKEPSILSLIKNKKNNYMYLNYSMPKEILINIIAYLELVVENRLFGEEPKTFKQLLEEYTGKQYIRKLYRGIK